jgi:hypothetical protein
MRGLSLLAADAFTDAADAVVRAAEFVPLRGNSLLVRMQTVRLHRPHPQYRLAE